MAGKWKARHRLFIAAREAHRQLGRNVSRIGGGGRLWHDGRLHVNRGLLAAGLLLVLLLGGLLYAGLAQAAPPAQGPGEVRLYAQHDGTRVDLVEGQVLVISLESNPATGYLWEVAEADPAIVRQVRAVEYQPSSLMLQAGPQPAPILGAPQQALLRFEAIAAGQSTLRLVYRRPWEKALPARTFSAQVQGVGRFSGVRRLPAPTPAPQPRSQDELLGSAPQLGLPPHFNWCEQGACTPVRDQGGCGSCWAFGTVGPLESLIKLNDGLERDLSEQYLVSCNTHNWGCDGGWWAHDYHWNFIPPNELGAGARREAEFPYQASNVPCNPPHTAYEQLTSWTYVGDWYSVPSVEAIKQAIYEHGPVAAAVCVGSAFSAYRGGVFAENECDAVNHAIVLVGWDDEQQVWYLRNSWGSAWGEAGYMRIKWGTSNVGYAANYVAYPGSSSRCAPEQPIACGSSVSGHNAQTGSTDRITAYACQPGRDESGPEYTYVFTATENIQAAFSLTNTTGDLDVFVLDGASGLCQAGSCLAYGDTSAALNAQANHVYYVVVDGYQGTTGDYTLDVQCQTSQPPEAPGNLTAQAVSADQIDLDWQDNASDESDFHIERSPDGVSGWSEVGSVGANQTSYSDTGLSCETTYYYRVRAHRHSDGQFSAYSPSAQAQTLSCPPQGICAPDWQLTCGDSDSWNNGAAGSTRQIADYACSTWDESGPEYTYTFVPDLSGQATIYLEGTTADLDLFVLSDAAGQCNSGNCIAYGDTAVQFEVQAGQTYYVTVDGYQGAVSDYTIYAQCAPPEPSAPAPPQPPTNLSAVPLAYDQIRLNWLDASDNEDGFQIERAPGGSGNWTQIGRVGADASQYLDSNLSCQTGYDYRVRAYRACLADWPFSGLAPGWQAVAGSWTVGSDTLSTAGIVSNTASAQYVTESYADLDYQAILWRSGCMNCANRLMIRGTPQPLGDANAWYQAYVFQYTANGYASVWKVVGGVPSALQLWTYSPAIVQGEAWNRLRVIALGNSLYFYINGTLIWSGADSDLAAGRVGIGMYRDDSTGNKLLVDEARVSTCGLTAPLPAVWTGSERATRAPQLDTPRAGDLNRAAGGASRPGKDGRLQVTSMDRLVAERNPYLGGASGYSNVASATTFACPVPPPHDDMNGAYAISAASFTHVQDISAATSANDDPTLPCLSGPGYQSVWYRFTPDHSGRLTADSAGSDYDTLLAVWTGGRGSLLNLACNDNYGATLQGRLEAPLLAGTTYYLEAVSRNPLSSGTLRLSVTFTPPDRPRFYLPMVLRNR